MCYRWSEEERRDLGISSTLDLLAGVFLLMGLSGIYPTRLDSNLFVYGYNQIAFSDTSSNYTWPTPSSLGILDFENTYPCPVGLGRRAMVSNNVFLRLSDEKAYGTNLIKPLSTVRTYGMEEQGTEPGQILQLIMYKSDDEASGL